MLKWLMLFATLVLTTFAHALPTFSPQLILKNQQGEQSTNAIIAGSTFLASKMATDTFVCNLTGGTAYPTACTYSQVKTALSLPTNASTSISALQNGTFTPQTEAISAAGAVSTTVMESTITNAGSTYAITLAAPSSQDGQIKIIKAITAMAGTVTLAMTNIKTPGFLNPTTGVSGTTTLTFTNVGDTAIFMAVGGKWQLIGGNAVAS
jgi:hypothetical protein